MLDNKRKGYVYRFVSMDNRTLYVGKCIDLNKRMKIIGLKIAIYIKMEKVIYIIKFKG